MKLALVVFAVLLALVPHHSEAASLGGALEAASQKTQDIINAALAKVEEVVEDVKSKAARLGEELRGKVDDFLKKIEKEVANALEKIHNRVNEIVGDLDDPNLSECRRLAGTVRDTFLSVVAEERKCVADKYENGKLYIAEISEIAKEVRSELKALREAAHECAENVDGLKATVEAIICINKIGLQAVWVSAKRVPEVTAVSVKLGFLVNTLPITLPQCAAKNGFSKIHENVDQLLSGVKQCVKEATEGGNKPVVTSTVKLPTTSEDFPEATEVVTEVTEVVTEATEVVTEATEVVTEATEVVTEATEVVTEATEVVTEATEVVTEATEVVTEADLS
ncbi:uncharacterized protein [Fopius arisanus]|uniref:Uncharacterized protein n=1 Tax=Fopius arisanus TaxID=64838 RepID=A0A9R1U2A8_9HYME|nr:PREDICTED: uncharacterized protein LOC105267413 [Fopius arisanus]